MANFWFGKNYFTPEVFQVATLKRAKKVEPQLISEIVFPTNQIISEALTLLSTQSRQTLTMIANDLSTKLLNFRNLNENHLPQIGQFVFLPDKIMHKNRASLTRALGRVQDINDRSVVIRMTSGL